MIDTLDIELSRSLVALPVVDELIKRLNNCEICQGEDYIKCRGKIRNYLIEINDVYIILKGSLCKFYHGNNLACLTKEQTKEALKQLTFETGLPIEKGRIKRIDVGINLILTNPTLTYLKSLNDTPKFVKNQRGSKVPGVYFDKANYTLAFYDKMRELKAKDPITYEINKEKKNVLRIEFQVRQRVKTTLKYPRSMKVVLLRSTTLHNKLIGMMTRTYESIVKNTEMYWDGIDTVPELKMATYYLGIVQMGGFNEFVKAINALRKVKCWDENKIKGAKDWAKGVCQKGKGKFLTNSEFVEELNKRVYEFLNSPI